jgi:hypothetical protein
MHELIRSGASLDLVDVTGYTALQRYEFVKVFYSTKVSFICWTWRHVQVHPSS